MAVLVAGRGRGDVGRHLALVAAVVAEHVTRAPARPGALAVVAELAAELGPRRSTSCAPAAVSGPRWCAGHAAVVADLVLAELVAIELGAAVIAEHVTRAPARPGALAVVAELATELVAGPRMGSAATS